jgi:hypothetical protein
MPEPLDNIDAFESKETGHQLPLGWLLLFWGLILFGIYYTVAYMPATSGWSQEKAYMESLK